VPFVKGADRALTGNLDAREIWVARALTLSEGGSHGSQFKDFERRRQLGTQDVLAAATHGLYLFSGFLRRHFGLSRPDANLSACFARQRRQTARANAMTPYQRRSASWRSGQNKEGPADGPEIITLMGNVARLYTCAGRIEDGFDLTNKLALLSVRPLDFDDITRTIKSPIGAAPSVGSRIADVARVHLNRPWRRHQLQEPPNPSSHLSGTTMLTAAFPSFFENLLGSKIAKRRSPLRRQPG